MAVQTSASTPPLSGQSKNDSEHLSWRFKLMYGMPNFAGAALIIPILVNMPKFYADVVAVPLGYLAIAIALARSMDAMSDPTVGWLSDHTRTRLGRRRPYLIIGPPLCGIAFYLMLSPPAGMPDFNAAIWFGATFILFFIFHTIFLLPYYALGPELTLDYNERSSLFSVRESFTILGTIVASAAPGLMMVTIGWTERRVYSFLGVVFAILLVTLFWILAWRVRERPEFATRESNPLVPGVRRALRNQPFRILLASYVVGSITGAIPATLLPFFNAYVIQPTHPATWLSIELIGYFGTGFLMLPLWVALARRVGKLNAWLLSFVMGITGGGAMFFLGKGQIVWLLVLICWAGASFGAGLFLPPSMQADVIDYDELYTGKRREAQYTAFWSILPKFVAIPSAAIPLAVLGEIGYVPNAVQTPEVIFAIKVIFALMPAVAGVLSFIIAWRFPITERIHRDILRGIELHNRGETAVDPMTAREVAPPNAREVDDETGWFLDYFSHGELRRYLSKGALSPVRDVALAAGASLAISAIAAIIAILRMHDLARDPGAAVSLSVVASGFAFAVFLFHVLRFRSAQRLASGVVAPDAVRAHLGEGM